MTGQKRNSNRKNTIAKEKEKKKKNVFIHFLTHIVDLFAFLLVSYKQTHMAIITDTLVLLCKTQWLDYDI